MYARVIVNLPVEGTFHYHIPAELAGRVKVGHLVEVSFGKKKAQAIVLSLDLRSPVEETKPILRVIDQVPVVNNKHLRLAQWLSRFYLAPLAECVRLFLPPGLSKIGDILVTPVIDPPLIEAESDTQQRLLNALAGRGPLRYRQIARALPRRDWRTAVARLADRGLLIRTPVLDPPEAKERQVRVAELAIAPGEVEAAIARHFDPANLPQTRHAAAGRRAEILRLLARERRQLYVGNIYASVENSSFTDLKVLAEDDLITIGEDRLWRDPLANVTFIPDEAPTLTPDQASVWSEVEGALERPQAANPFLLHGVTGSGKTEIYLRAVEKVLAQGRGAIVLVPEIALTPQTIRRFGARFPGQLGLIHSVLSRGERYDTWRRARSGHIRLIIGARSALFTPMPDIGLIVIDECHDDSYKQDTPLISLPSYHTIPTAIELARIFGGLVLMGSATPNVATYARSVPQGNGAKSEYKLLELPARIMGHRKAIESQAVHYHIDRTRYTHLPDDPDEAVMIELPPVKVVDMRQELRAGNRSIFSRALQIELEGVLKRDEQAILFLNRRGTSSYVFCRNCGHTLLCPNCDTPLTWHTYRDARQRQRGVLVCHHCNHREGHPQNCPNCGSEQIRFFGGGTELVEQELLKQFPQAHSIRWDRDTTGGKDAHTQLLNQFIRREANVLVGTQMVAKGLDLPLVTLVGVISADTALYLPDYRSGERTFQLLTQVAGRAGRGLFGGKVVLQTYNPDHYAIKAAAEHNYHAFYQKEIDYRGEMGYPPYSRLIRLVIQNAESRQAQETAERLHSRLLQRIADQRLSNTSLIGPAPCFYPRRNKAYRWHIIIRGPAPATILEDFRLPHGVYIDVDPVSLL